MIKTNRKLNASWYTPISQESEDEPARFKVRPLTGAQALEVLDDYDPRKGRFLSRGIQLALRHGLLDWENILDEHGNPLECKPENLRYIPAVEANEVGNHIMDLAELGGEEEKNSESP